MSPVSVVCPHGNSDCMACGVEFTRLRSQVATLQAENAKLKADVEIYEGLNKQRSEVIDQLFLVEAERHALKVQLEGQQATVRVHEFTIRQVSTARDGAIAQARDLALRSAAACNAMEAERDAAQRERDELKRENEALAAQNIYLNQGCVDYEKALGAAGAKYDNGGVIECAACGWELVRCDSAPVCEPSDEYNFCAGRIARRALAAPPPTPPAGPELPTEVLAIMRDPTIPLESDEEATNFLFSRGLGVVIGRGCKACMAREFPYWHPADRPCPVSSDTPPTPPAGTPRPNPFYVDHLLGPEHEPGAGQGCKPWCGTPSLGGRGRDGAHHVWDGPDRDSSVDYCTTSCATAGRSLHPREGAGEVE